MTKEMPEGIGALFGLSTDAVKQYNAQLKMSVFVPETEGRIFNAAQDLNARLAAGRLTDPELVLLNGWKETSQRLNALKDIVQQIIEDDYNKCRFHLLEGDDPI